jgi:hypothetical protein
MSDLVLKNGKFYRDGIIVPLEHGNIEQITLMNKELKYINSFEEVGFEPRIIEEEKYIIEFSFKCPKCSSNISYSDEYEDYGHYLSIIDSEGTSCRKCGTKYGFHLNDYHDLVVKYEKEARKN